MPQAALPTLRTPRLTLRPLELSDADAITEGIGNYDVSKWLSSVPYPYTRDDAIWFINKMQVEGHRVWAIDTRDGLIGVIGCDPHFGYWLARTAWRKGYGFEAAYAVANYWFSDLSAGNLLSAYFPGNERSSAVLYALGFEDMGVKPHEARAMGQTVMSTEIRLTRAAWEARRAFNVTTKRLRIRPLDQSDADNMISLAVLEVARNTASFDTNWTQETVLEYIRARTWRGYAFGMFAVEEQGRFVGVVGVGGTPPSAMYAFKPEVWGRGIATEAVGAFLTLFFSRYPVNTLFAEVVVDNPASGKVLEKLGFQETGTGTCASKARLEPQPSIKYAVTRDTFKATK